VRGGQATFNDGMIGNVTEGPYGEYGLR
jgi:hypothetical protein